MADNASSMKTLVAALLVIASPAAAQPAPSVPLMVSRANKQHNRNWHKKTPQPVAPLTMPPPPRACFGCPEECCEGSCDCSYVGAQSDPCIECPDECCGKACCAPPKPPAACAGCDADHCCHGACQTRACTAAD